MGFKLQPDLIVDVSFEIQTEISSNCQKQFGVQVGVEGLN